MSQYTAEDIEVLTGLEPVRKRPGMYTDTTRPNHLAQEVIDNSVDEALAGHADQIEVSLNKNGSVTCQTTAAACPWICTLNRVSPGWRSYSAPCMPGASSPTKITSSAVACTVLGVSVVNALSSELEIVIRRDGRCTA